jgi:hypothetical protein
LSACFYVCDFMSADLETQSSNIDLILQNRSLVETMCTKTGMNLFFLTEPTPGLGWYKNCKTSPIPGPD